MQREGCNVTKMHGPMLLSRDPSSFKGFFLEIGHLLIHDIGPPNTDLH